MPQAPRAPKSQHEREKSRPHNHSRSEPLVRQPDPQSLDRSQRIDKNQTVHLLASSARPDPRHSSPQCRPRCSAPPPAVPRLPVLCSAPAPLSARPSPRPSLSLPGPPSSFPASWPRPRPPARASAPRPACELSTRRRRLRSLRRGKADARQTSTHTLPSPP